MKEKCLIVFFKMVILIFYLNQLRYTFNKTLFYFLNQEFALKHVFNIPDNIILPGDEPNVEIEKYDEEELLKEIDLLTEEIIQVCLNSKLV